MMCKVLLQGLKEAVSREHQLRECQFWGRIKRQIWGGWGRAGSSLSPEKRGREGLSCLLQVHVIPQSQMQGAETSDLMRAE